MCFASKVLFSVDAVYFISMLIESFLEKGFILVSHRRLDFKGYSLCFKFAVFMQNVYHITQNMLKFRSRDNGYF